MSKGRVRVGDAREKKRERERERENDARAYSESTALRNYAYSRETEEASACVYATKQRDGRIARGQRIILLCDAARATMRLSEAAIPPCVCASELARAASTPTLTAR